MLLATVALTLAATGLLDRFPDAGEMSKIGCYVSLAYDLAPLIDASLPDPATASPGCATQAARAM
ncbi:MAG TPA: hypothetical protein VGK44_19865 [Casimicrobiaceae bacterium]|jgi:hypothetical protein